jgi:hypothetical protein
LICDTAARNKIEILLHQISNLAQEAYPAAIHFFPSKEPIFTDAGGKPKAKTMDWK